MRKLFTIALFLFAAACGSDSTGPAQQNGTVRFTRDASTCVGTPLSFDFFMDGTALGTATLATGASQSYSVAAGTHVFGAKVTNSNLIFANLNGTVAPSGTFNYTMTCQ